MAVLAQGATPGTGRPRCSSQGPAGWPLDLPTNSCSKVPLRNFAEILRRTTSLGVCFMRLLGVGEGVEAGEKPPGSSQAGHVPAGTPGRAALANQEQGLAWFSGPRPSV